MVVPKLPSSCMIATRLIGVPALLAISIMLPTVRVAIARALGCMRKQ